MKIKISSLERIALGHAIERRTTAKSALEARRQAEQRAGAIVAEQEGAAEELAGADAEADEKPDAA